MAKRDARPTNAQSNINNPDITKIRIGQLVTFAFTANNSTVMGLPISVCKTCVNA